MSCKGRTWVNCDGRKNFPDGEVFTGPVENTVNGTIRFTYPLIYLGNEIEDVRLTFRDGEVVEASASKGEALLREILKIEGATRVGEIAIGTNYGIKRFTKHMLFDEKIGGTMHLALGRSIPESGGKNSSTIHLDILKDMKDGGKIYADGELFYENGVFVE
jgi:aminopeptidase